MSNKIRLSISATAVVLGLGIVNLANAQLYGPGQQQSSVSAHHQRQYVLMKDMSEEMNRMTEQMLRGGLTPEERKQMSQRMKFMSTMMRRMSGLADRSAMSEPQMQKQMEEMRKQMDAMMRDPSMKPK